MEIEQHLCIDAYGQISTVIQSAAKATRQDKRSGIFVRYLLAAVTLLHI